METRDLIYFLTVAAKGNIGRAAEELGLTQPALTKSIARLERELHGRLLERTPKGVNVTSFGQHALRHATHVRTALDDARREFADLAKGDSGHVRIGTGLAIAQYLLPTVCAKLLASSPRITLDITVGTGRGLAPALRNGDLDLVLSGIPPEHEPGLRHETIIEDHVVVIARRGHALQRRRGLTLGELAQQRWILSKSGSLLVNWLNQHWRDAGIPAPVPAVETDSIATLLGIVAASDLLTFDSWSTIRHSPFHAALRPLSGASLTWRRKLGATYRNGGYLSAATRKLIDLLVEAGRGEGRRK